MSEVFLIIIKARVCLSVLMTHSLWPGDDGVLLLVFGSPGIELISFRAAGITNDWCIKRSNNQLYPVQKTTQNMVRRRFHIID